MITITRKGLTLSIDASMIPAQGSQNVPVRYVNDTDEYTNYLITPVVGWTERNGLCKSSIAEYSDGIIKLPARAFAQSCMASIAIKMTDPSDPTHVEVTYPQSFFIEKAPDGTLILPPSDEEWKQYIDDFVTQYFNQNIDPEMDEFKAEIIQNQTDFKEQMNEDFDNFIERTDGNPDALYRGYLVSKNNVYSGVASNDGINLGKVVGKSIQNGTPTPDSPVEIENVEITKLTSHAKNIINIDEIDKYYQSNNANTNTYKITGLLKDTNYTMSSDVPFTSPATVYFNGNITETNGVSKNKPKTFKSNADGELIFHIRIDSQSGYKLQDFKDKKYYIQLELGDKATPYVDGNLSDISTNITLRSTPNGAADIYKNGTITRQITEYILDGNTPNHILPYSVGSDTSKGFGYFSILLPNLADKNVLEQPFLSDKITYINNAGKAGEFKGYVTAKRLVIFTNKYTDKNSFIKYLQSEPIKIQYELATPTIEYYTVPTLPSYYPNTVAFHDSVLEPTEIEWHVETEKGYAPPNENLLINPYFQAWQRGTSFTLPIASYNGYTADIVYSDASTFGAMKIEKARADGGLKMTVLKEGYTYAPYGYYMKDSDLTKVRKKQVTLSYSVDGVIHVFTVDNLGFLVIQNDEIYEPSSYDGDDERCETNKRIITIQWTGLSVNETKTFDWIKLEFGDIVTPCIPPSEEENLLDCLPYYQNLGNITCAYIDEISGKHTFYYLVQGRFHIPMIGVPSITCSKVGDAANGSDLGVSANFSGRVTNEKIRSCQLSSSITNHLITLFDVIAEAEIK